MSSMRVLLVEDDWADVLLIEDALQVRRSRVRLRVAADGVEAMEHLEDPPVSAELPDLIVVAADRELLQRGGEAAADRLS